MPEYIPQWTTRRQAPDDFTRGYLEAAEWLLDESEDRDTIEGWSTEALAEAYVDCAGFKAENTIDLVKYCKISGRDMVSAGCDFWLTRNHHGAGFWDRGDDPVFKRLTDAAHVYGETCAYSGDDNRLYFG